MIGENIGRTYVGNSIHSYHNYLDDNDELMNVVGDDQSVPADVDVCKGRAAAGSKQNYNIIDNIT